MAENVSNGNSKTMRVFELPLDPDGSPSKQRQYIRLPAPHPPYVLRLSIDAGSKASKAGILFTNFPLDGSAFQRSKFHQSSLPGDPSKSIHLDLHITKAGAFEFYVEYESSAPTEDASGSQKPARGSRIQSKHCYFNVDPLLKLPRRSPILDKASKKPLAVGKGGVVQQSTSDPITLDALVIQSVIAKWMGPINEWDPHLANVRDRGYNMLHFTPLQERGSSNSPYSIFDQLAFSADLFAKKGLSNDEREEQIKTLLARLREQHGFLSLTDVVWNHTANNSPWLEEHPDAGYNVDNSPHLRAALELDTALIDLSVNLEAKYKLKQTIDTASDMDAVMRVFEHDILPSLNLWQYYVIDIDAAKAAFRQAKKGNVTQRSIINLPSGILREEKTRLFAEACLPPDWHILGERYKAKVDAASALAFADSEDELVSLCNDLNVDRYKLFNDDLTAILQNTRSRIQYTRVDAHGPRLGKVTATSPLSDNYFTLLKNGTSLANNGWIWNADALQDFAAAGSRAYLRREVIGWGDCVKLRYGLGPDDSPYLWQHMTKYTELMATTFDGFRIDNCHSTPIHVGEYLLDAARRINPNLYVCAELFTGNEDLDTYFVSRLGINSLIREAMNGHDPKDQSRLLYIYGVGKPVGSMDADCLIEHGTVTLDGQGSQPCTIEQLQGSVPHAFMMDCTHDNESPADKRTAEDALATGALVPMCWSAIGSNKGFDDLYPKLLNLVTDARHYEVYDNSDESGIGSIKRVLNHLHTEMALQGFKEGHLHQENDYIIAHRVHPSTHDGYIVVARTAFKGSERVQGRGDISPIQLRRTKATYILGVTIDITDSRDLSDKSTLRGLSSRLKKINEPHMQSKSDEDGPYLEFVVPDHFPPGSIMLFATEMDGLDAKLDSYCLSGSAEAFADVNPIDLNVILFHADGEERDVTAGEIGSYAISGLGTLPYCGLEGWMHPLRHIMRYNDLGHPLCAHLREGSWALDYIVGRLERQSKTLPSLSKSASWFKERFDAIKARVPGFMRPRFFAMIVSTAYRAARNRAFAQSSDFIREGHSFTKALALVGIQMYGQVSSASLDPEKSLASLAAGLPHFAAGWARCWGRDVFISLRGLLLTTGQFGAAREHILAFASVIKHGLVPNLLDSLRTPRFNSRDSPWWFLQAIQDYVDMSPEGTDLLKVKVKRRFPLDDTWVPWNDPQAYSYESSIAEVIQEILQRHATGLHFREYNAGPNLDMQMRSEGFQIDIEVDWNTGFIHGGNEFNCGTWMDKMGESEKAGNKGLPGTPRDGAPVEITGLLKSALRWLSKLSESGHFPFRGVDAEVQGQQAEISYRKWDALLQQSFERHYFVPLDSSQDGQFVVDSNMVTRRGIYKDVYGTPAARAKADYQLRANFPVAMAVAPELFTPEHALVALRNYEKYLVGPLGVATLDPIDTDYRPYYDNANDTNDFLTAKGRNYHQGPEWVWPLGYFLRAYLYFDSKAGAGKADASETIHHISSLLLRHREYIDCSEWAGLPELTNRDGEYCRDSCETQAWSASTLLDALEDVYRKTKL